MLRLHQEHIEPVREHVTTIDGEIQTWVPDTNLVTSKYGKAATCTCVPVFVWSPDTVQEYNVNRGFNPIWQQPSHRSHVPFFWTENIWTRWKTGGVQKYPLIRSILTQRTTPLLTPCSASLAKLSQLHTVQLRI